MKSEEWKVKNEKWRVVSVEQNDELRMLPLCHSERSEESREEKEKSHRFALNDKGSEKWKTKSEEWETNSEKWRELLRYWVVVGGGWAHSHFGTPRRGEPLCSPVMTLIWTSPQPPFKGGMQIWRLTAVRALKGRVNSAQCAALGKQGNPSAEGWKPEWNLANPFANLAVYSLPQRTQG